MATKSKKSLKKKCNARKITASRQNAGLKASKVGRMRSLDKLSSWELTRFQSALNAAANLNRKRLPKKASKTSKKLRAKSQIQDSPSSSSSSSSHHNSFNMKNNDDSSSSESDDSSSPTQEQFKPNRNLQEAKKLKSRWARENRKN